MTFTETDCKYPIVIIITDKNDLDGVLFNQFQQLYFTNP